MWSGLGPGHDPTVVTAGQLRDLVGRLRTAGQHHDGDPDILVVLDAGYDVHRLAYLLADLPMQLLGRLRADRVLRLPAPPRRPGRGGRPARHGRTIGAYLGLVPPSPPPGRADPKEESPRPATGTPRRLLIEAAWHHRPRYRLGAELRRRQNTASPTARDRGERANRRLHTRWAGFDARHKRPVVANTAIAASSPAGAGPWPS